MGIHLFAGRLVLALVLTLDVVYSLQVSVWTWGERQRDRDDISWESGEGYKAVVICIFKSVGGPTLPAGLFLLLIKT